MSFLASVRGFYRYHLKYAHLSTQTTPTIAQSYLNEEEQLRRRGWLGSKSTCLQCRMTNSLPFTVVPMVSDQAYIQAVPLSPYLGPCSSDRREGRSVIGTLSKFTISFLWTHNTSKIFFWRILAKRFRISFCNFWHNFYMKKGQLEKFL